MGDAVAWPVRMLIPLPDGRTLVVEVSDVGDDVTLWLVDQPERTLVRPSVTALVIGMTLQRASTIAGRRGAAPHDRRSMARQIEERAGRLAKAVELELQRRRGR